MINGIQHIGIGVNDRDKSYDFYRDALNFSVPISKNTGNCAGVVPFIKEDEIRNVIIPLNPFGGALVEIFQYTSRKPAPIPREVDFSYNGFLFYSLKVKNIQGSLEKIEQHGGRIVSRKSPFSPMQERGWNTAIFQDIDGIYGTLLEYPTSNVGYGKGHPRIGGVEHVAIGVSNIKESTDFYRNVLGYDNVLYSTEGSFPEWDTMFGKGKKLKRVLLKRSAKPNGLFRHFLRGGMIELIEAEDNSGKHNFEGRKWGDIGFMELCFDVTNIDETLESIQKMGVEIIAPPHKQNMGMNTLATFAYIADPDGSKLEFADISSLPVPYFVIRLFVNPFAVGIAQLLKIL